MQFTKVLVILGAAFALAVSTGCSCKPGSRKFNVQSTATPDILGGGVIEVDAIAVSGVELPQWQAQAMDDYASSILRRSANDSGRLKTLYLSADSPKGEIPMSEDIWNKWIAEGGQHLVLLTPALRVPGASGSGPADPRRLVLPLNRCRWDTGTLQIEVSRNGLRALTVPKAEEAN